MTAAEVIDLVTALIDLLGGLAGLVAAGHVWSLRRRKPDTKEPPATAQSERDG
jgi:hypothetical protein